MSWYEMSLKLHLSEVQSRSSYDSVLENLTQELMSEASTRMRRSFDVLVSGLATEPNPRKLPSLVENIEQTVFSPAKTQRGSRRTQIMDSTPAPDPPRRYRITGKRNQDLKSKASSANWVPESTRMRQLNRDLVVAQENLHDIILREEEARREMRQLRQSDLERAHSMESLGARRKIECACCLQKFSFVNLPLKVSHKAIIDIRKKWSNGATGTWWEASDQRWSAVPRCYDEVLVCLMCSQYFQKQEEYRPSFEQIAYEGRRLAYLETKRRELEYWDPLRMCEKDRYELPFVICFKP